MATRPKAIIESRNGEKFSPITITKNVLTDDGQNLHDILSDRKEDMMTPTIENSSSMFKVGQGDNVDYSANVVNGAYESMVLKGKSMVNCIQEPSSQDVVLPYEFAEGQYVTINDTKESGALGVELKGQTLVNVVDYNDLNLKNATRNGDYFTLKHGVDINQSWVIPKKNKQYLYKPNTVYTIIVNITENTTGQKLGISNIYTCTSYINGKNRFDNLLGESKLLVRTGSDVNVPANQNEVRQLIYFGIWDGSGDLTSHIKFNFMILEGDWTDKETPPYFEGMTSCKMPILHTNGKNLLPYNEMFISPFTSATPYITKNVATFPFTLGVNGRGIGIKFKVEPNTTYTLSSNVVIPNTVVGTAFYKNESDTTNHNNKLGIAFSTNIEESAKTFTTPNECNWIVCGMYILYTYEQSGGTVVISEMPKLQLEKNTQATTYEPHKSSILSLPEEVVLRSLPNGVCDTFNTRTGVYTQRIGEVVLNGSEDWNLGTSANWYADGNTFGFYFNSFTLVQGTSLNIDKFLSTPNISTNDIEGCYINTQWSWVGVRIYKTKLSSLTVDAFKQWLSQNPITIQYRLAEPIITKVNISSTLKSWNTTTHIYSEIPENSLYPILSHSNPSYPVILKPSTKYSIVANSYSNSHTNSTINFNLGGATVSTTVGSRVTTITTPSTLSNELLTMSGRGNKLNNVMVIEGDVVGDEPYFEGICDCKSPILTNVGKNLFNFSDSTMKSSWWITVENGIVNVKKEDLSTNYSVIIPAQSNAKYKVSGNNFTRAFYAFLDKDYNVLHADELVQRTTKSLSPQGTAYALFYLNHEDIEKVTNLQIEEGSTETPYEPYKSNTTTFKQKDGKMIVLRSLPNGVCDTLNVETGEYVQRIGEVVLDGSENWAFYGATGEGVTTAFKLSLTGHISAWMGGNGHCDRLKFVSGDYIYRTNNEGITTDAYNFVIRVLNEKASTIEEFKSYLKTKSLTVQYELAAPIVTEVDLSGYPFSYEKGYVILSSGSIEQSLTPKVEYSVATNRNGQIRSNQKMVERHQKQLDRLQAMVLTNLVNTQYEQALTNLKYDLKNVREEVK